MVADLLVPGRPSNISMVCGDSVILMRCLCVFICAFPPRCVPGLVCLVCGGGVAIAY